MRVGVALQLDQVFFAGSGCAREEAKWQHDGNGGTVKGVGLSACMGTRFDLMLGRQRGGDENNLALQRRGGEKSSSCLLGLKS